MTTPKTDALMALADRYAFHIPGSQHSDEARAVLLAALQEQAREGEAVAWLHGCNVLCADIDLWIDRCPHCGKPRPAAPAPQPAREGGAVVPSAILARGRFHFFKGEDGEPDDWEWFEEGTNCEHGCIDAVIVRADALSAPQPAREGEAVAWRFVDDEDNGHISYSTTPPTDAQVAYLKKWNRPAWEPLYAAPQPAQPAQPESIECDCGRIHKKTRYGWACSEPAQPEQGPST